MQATQLCVEALCHLGFEGHQLEEHLHGEEHGEDDVQHVGEVGDMVRLVAMLDRQERIDTDWLPCWTQTITIVKCRVNVLLLCMSSHWKKHSLLHH